MVSQTAAQSATSQNCDAYYNQLVGHTFDFIERVRSWLPALAPLARLVPALYVESVTHKREFVGRVEKSEEKFEKDLHEMGYERNPLAAYKRLALDQDRHETGSWRRVLEDGHQIHIILFPAEGESVDVYAHYEWAWDHKPIKHYRGKEVDDKRGAAMARKDLQRYYAAEYDTLVTEEQ